MNQIRKISADVVYPVSAPPIADGVVVLDASGAILAVDPRDRHDPASLEVHAGALIPGFVNAHCHLELSHMLGKVDTGTGLIPFITGVVTRREAAAEVIAEAIRVAEQDMLRGGIVAVGDISNTVDTFPVKSAGRLRYYSFIELFDFLQENGAEKAFHDWLAVYERLALPPNGAKAMTPHAPYTVSRSLFAKIRDLNGGARHTISIHNQETPPENELFLHGTGAFTAFYSRFGISLEAFRATGKTSVHYALENLDPGQRTLFVHNTLSTADDLAAAHAWSPHTYWASCPNANLYIENRLPNYQLFLDAGARVCIGTDSLTSNWQLSVLEEMKTISRYQSYVPFETLLRWATLHGAQALGFDDTLGSLEVGKRPGLLLLTGLNEKGGLEAQSKVERLDLP